MIRDGAVTPHEDIIGDRLPEDLDLQDVGNYLLGFAVDVWVY